MRRYIRNRVQGGCYFFTLALADRQQRWLVEYVKKLRQAFRMVKRRHPFEMKAVVVLPEHLHCIWTLPAGDDDFPVRWFLIKSAFSRNIPKGEAISASRGRKGERGIWQRRYWEHTIRDEQDYVRHVDYIHYNPIKHGLVTDLKDWPYSSFGHYVKAGAYPENWAVSQEVMSMVVEFE